MKNGFDCGEIVIIEDYSCENCVEVSIVLGYAKDKPYYNEDTNRLVAKGEDEFNNDLQREAISFVSASSQAKFVTKLLEEDFLTAEEMDVFKRARNYKTTSHPKSCDVITYKFATGLEAVIGYLELENKKERINEIMKFILGE